MNQHLGEHISHVVERPLFGYPGCSGSHSFPVIMVENTYVLILQCRLRGRHVLIDIFIVIEYAILSLYRDTKHPQLVIKVFDQFSVCLEKNELTRECVNSPVPKTVRHGTSLHIICPKLLIGSSPSRLKSIDSSPSRLESQTSVRRPTVKIFGSSPIRLESQASVHRPTLKLFGSSRS